MINTRILKILVMLLLLPLLHACAVGSVFSRKEVPSGVKDSSEPEPLNDMSAPDTPVPATANETSLVAEDADETSLVAEDSEVAPTETFEESEPRENELDLLAARIDRMLDSCEKQIKVLHNLNKTKSPPVVRAASASAAIMGTDKLLVGEIEKVRLTPPGHVFNARIDTGATTSSLDARDIETFERDGSTWVRFKIAPPDSDSLDQIEEPVVRHVRILQSVSSDTDRRPVVKLQFQLGPVMVIEEFTLVDREHLNHQVLVGRNVLKDLMVVDVAKKFIVPLPAPPSDGNGK